MKGLIIRLFLFVKYSIPRTIARLKGAKIGSCSIIPLKLAFHANSNLIIGEDVIIEATDLDLRGKIRIGSHCVLGKDVHIIRLSHQIDDSSFPVKRYPELVVSSNSWLATGSVILPSCCYIAEGTVVGAFSVMVKDSEERTVYGGNPAFILRRCTLLFDDTVVVSLMGGDLLNYIKARKE